MNESKLKKGLSFWFTIHFIADTVFALPLMIFPAAFLSLLGWQTVDPISARLVAAALFGIGIESFLGRNASLESFKTMLDLKIIWSAAAIIGFVLNLFAGAQGRPWSLWVLSGIFAGFNILWIYWRVKIK